MATDDYYYITTPIYYVNDVPHIGHAYTTVAADAAARYQRLRGKKVHFLTGTDEHGQKIEKAAATQNLRPQQLADQVVVHFQHLWETLSISHDDFIRTTENRHKLGAQEFFKQVMETGDIYQGEYEGWYCVPDETYWTEGQLVDGTCPTCGRAVERLGEPSYFFRLSKYGDALLDHIEKHPQFIQPESKRNEVISFLKQGLRDLSISRTSFDWGVPVPGNDEHIMYVWFDALSNYMTAIGYGSDQSQFEEWWPATVHMVGKDILRFHAIYWPAFLMSANLPLPQQVYAHGWWTIEGKKMSKSTGNFVDPFGIVEQYGADPFRYFLLREFSFGLDGDFSQAAFVKRLNSDLANDLGNLASRTIAMVGKYCGGSVPEPRPGSANEAALIEHSASEVHAYCDAMEKLAFDQALRHIWSILDRANKYVDEMQPWQLAKSEEQRPILETTLCTLITTLHTVSLTIAPFMPTLAEKLRQKLSVEPLMPKVGVDQLNEQTLVATSLVGHALEKGEPLFKRVETP